LQDRGWIAWKLGDEDSPTMFFVAESGSSPAEYRTWEAEALAQRIADREGIPWLPVPYPGGLDRFNETVAKISEMRSGTPRAAGRPQGRTR
jgi:hypothetical protein